MSYLALAATLAAIPEVGCVWATPRHSHVITFHGDLVDAASGGPIPGVRVRVTVGEETIYRGATGPDGVLAFTYVLRSCGAHSDTGGTGGPLMLRFGIETGGYGRVEIPVGFVHDKGTLSLGEIRVLREEGL